MALASGASIERCVGSSPTLVNHFLFFCIFTFGAEDMCVIFLGRLPVGSGEGGGPGLQKAGLEVGAGT